MVRSAPTTREPTTSPSETPCSCSTPPTGSRWSATRGSTNSRARNAKPPTAYPAARRSSSAGAPNSPGRCGRARNRPGGYWVAAADPQAASQALTGTLPSKNLHRAVLLSDGASRLVDPFGLATWEELLALLDASGPDELVRQVRAAEAVDPEGRQWPRTKRTDDATAVYLVLDEAANP